MAAKAPSDGGGKAVSILAWRNSQKGRVVQSNFNDYRPMRMNEAPIVETHVVQSSEPPGGVGEVPTATVSPAVANAIFATTGKRIRKLPIKGLDAVR
jgi:isoquinoline 1-oxidoreductase beta subunit